ncbi:MAG TPA: M48 family metalloprotease, partial [Candidatus Methanoperedens sp.]|nr:M48 family metalloprotease [Candidatus Methanoperedens sp.]
AGLDKGVLVLDDGLERLEEVELGRSGARGKQRAAVLGGLALAAGALLSARPAAAKFDLFKALETVVEHKDTLVKTGEALRKGFADLTPQEEYYLGRAVAARILGEYRTLADDDRTRYVNTLGQVLARASSRPETFGGWHFLLLDSDEVNAFAAPGGFVFVTRGLYATCATEEQLAAVLAHEVSHVTLRHGLGAIKSERLTEAFTILGTTAVKEYSKGQLQQLTTAFEGSINDIANQMIVSGYSQGQEYAADAEAARVAWRAGYNPAGLTEFLEALREKGKRAAAKGFFSTHPPAGERLERAAASLKVDKLAGDTDAARTRRFSRYALR